MGDRSRSGARRESTGPPGRTRKFSSMSPKSQNYKPIHVLQLRTSVSPQSLLVPTEALVRELDPNLPVYEVMTMDQAMTGANGYFLFIIRWAPALPALSGLLVCYSRW